MWLFAKSLSSRRPQDEMISVADSDVHMRKLIIHHMDCNFYVVQQCNAMDHNAILDRHAAFGSSDLM